MPTHLKPSEIIKSPLITERLSALQEHENIWGFQVDRRANKIQIKQAIESLWGVKVLSVNTQVRKGKPRRVGFAWTKAPTWKRALVKLAEGDRIE